jgi:Mn2+/Fe2+ NRAMP family transporter
MLLSQASNGLLLPFVLIFMLLLVNNRRLMGKYVNSRIYNFFAIITIIAMVGLSAALIITQFFKR